MSRRLVTARVINDGDAFAVQLNQDGPIVLTGETYGVCSRVAAALVDPDCEIGTEMGEVADAIRRVYNEGESE